VTVLGATLCSNIFPLGLCCLLRFQKASIQKQSRANSQSFKRRVAASLETCILSIFTIPVFYAVWTSSRYGKLLSK
jgi:hypothetical protein